MPFHSNLPPAQSLALFYHLCMVLGLLTLAAVAVSRWRIRGPKRVADGLPPCEAHSRQVLLSALGALWLLDGLLQAQPTMVTRFVGGFLAPLLTGQPGALTWVIHMGLRVWSASPAVFNAIATFVQIGIGLGLLFGRPQRGQRIALWVSLVWGTMVWVVGEGMGGIFVGGAWFTGAPGSVLLYMLAGVALLLPGKWWASDRALKALRWSLAALFGLSALLEALPGSGWWSGGLSGYALAMAQMPQPGIFSAPLYGAAGVLQQDPALWNFLVVGVLALLAVCFALWPKNRVVLWLAVIWVFLGWWIGQDFGVLGGMGTDPNTGAILLVGLFTYADRAGLVALPRWRIHDRRSFHALSRE